jgi:hypothetical protein
MKKEEIRVHLPILIDYLWLGYIPFPTLVDLIDKLLDAAPEDFTYDQMPAIVNRKVINVDFNSRQRISPVVPEKLPSPEKCELIELILELPPLATRRLLAHAQELKLALSEPIAKPTIGQAVRPRIVKPARGRIMGVNMYKYDRFENQEELDAHLATLEEVDAEAIRSTLASTGGVQFPLRMSFKPSIQFSTREDE